MSFYYKYRFKFSDHGFRRIQERLGLKGLDEFKAKDIAMELIKNPMHEYEDKQHFYIQAGDKDLYFVVKKATNLIVTLTPMSAEKLLKIYMTDDD